MSHPDRKTSTVRYPNPSIQSDLLELYREHGAHLPPLSVACANGMRAELLKAGIEPPPAKKPPAQIANAITAATKKRSKDRF